MRFSLFSWILSGFTAVTLTANEWWNADVGQALDRSGERRDAWVQALEQVPESQQPGAAFLITHMPDRDLAELPVQWLLENTKLAYLARETAPWSRSIPEAIFLNDILPYANIDETREDWRGKLREIALPLVADAVSPAKAAQTLNEQLFNLVNVRYSTQRRKANQSAFESMETGLASCTGLSILLVNACRSVGVPARLVGIPSWVDKRGNHTWVEIWDGRWQFLGAAEPDPQGLDRGWFVHDASLAIKDSIRHAIYAVSYQRTDTPFPMVWTRNRGLTDGGTVSAVNVTDRYTGNSKAVDPKETRLLVKVYERRGTDRLSRPVTVRSMEDETVMEGYTKDESADTNDILEFRVKRGGKYLVSTLHDTRRIQQEIGPFETGQHQVVLYAEEVQLAGLMPPVCYVPPRPSYPLSQELKAQIQEDLGNYFRADEQSREAWTFRPALDEALFTDEPAIRALAWQIYQDAPVHESAKQDFEANQVQYGSHTSPYVVKTVGERPSDGWPLFIAMHGGGNTRQEVNDRQWRIMQNYYTDHPEAGGYLYLALRAPNNTWNGFYDDYVYPLISQLIRQFLLFGDVDPNKVFLMGYSHGGYGAFAIGPKIPHRFAAVHASAAAPTDGLTTAKTLRNTIFTYMIGEKDTAYGRIDRCRAFDQAVEALRGQRVDIYPVLMEYKEGLGHGGLPDRNKILDMYPAIRNPVPRELTWAQTDSVVRHFFWLQVPNPSRDQEIEAICRENLLVVKTEGVTSATVRLDSRLIQMYQPLTVTVNGKSKEIEVEPSFKTLAKTLMESGDPELAFTVELDLSKDLVE